MSLSSPNTPLDLNLDRPLSPLASPDSVAAAACKSISSLPQLLRFAAPPGEYEGNGIGTGNDVNGPILPPPLAMDPFVLASIRLLLSKSHYPSPSPLPHRRLKRVALWAPPGCLSLPIERGKRPRVIAVSATKKRKGGHSSSNNSNRRALRYLKPGALAQLRDAQRSARCSLVSASSSSIISGVNRVADRYSADGSGIENRSRNGNGNAFRDEETAMLAFSPFRGSGPLFLQRKKLHAPRNPHLSFDFTPPPPRLHSPPPTAAEGFFSQESSSPSDSLIESLPLELLVRIVCSLHHDELKPTFHVCRKLRQAVLIARQCHFNFTTPNRDRQELFTATPNSRQDGNMVEHLARPLTPNAPRQAPRPSHTRIPIEDIQHLAAPLFQSSSSHVRSERKPRCSRVTSRGVASHRVLFYEEELCQAVAQNSL